MTELAMLKGFTPGAAGIWVLVALAVITAIKGWPKLREIQTGADGSLRTDLMARIGRLEADLQKVSEEQAQERARHAAEIQVLRHRLNNETASLDALLLMLKLDPDKVMESVDAITEMRARKAQQIALEQGAIAGKVKT
jgi:hypothetical protein